MNQFEPRRDKPFHTHTDTCTYTQTGRHTDRQTDRQPDSQTDEHTLRQRWTRMQNKFVVRAYRGSWQSVDNTKLVLALFVVVVSISAN